MSQKRGYAEEEEDGEVLLLAKRSRASAPPPISLERKEKSGLCSSSKKGGGGNVIGHGNGHGNGNDEEEEEEEDDDYTSSSGTSTSSSSSSDEEEDENKETIPYIPGRPKPQISRPPPLLQNSDLLSRISSFLPQLQAANADIEQRLASGESLDDLILDNVKNDEEGENGENGEGKQYIEMNLGLGVLKEKTRKRRGSISLGDDGTSGSSDEEELEESEGSLKDGAEVDGEGHVMSELMGLKSRAGQKPKTKPGIQEVDEG